MVDVFTGLVTKSSGIAELIQIDVDGQPRAACVRFGVHPELFFPNMSGSTDTVFVDVRAASACSHCPVRMKCREGAREHQRQGFWGNVAFDSSGSERTHIVVDPDGREISLAMLLATHPERWVSAFRGRRGFVRRGRNRKK